MGYTVYAAYFVFSDSPDAQPSFESAGALRIVYCVISIHTWRVPAYFEGGWGIAFAVICTYWGRPARNGFRKFAWSVPEIYTWAKTRPDPSDPSRPVRAVQPSAMPVQHPLHPARACFADRETDSRQCYTLHTNIIGRSLSARTT